MFSGVLYTVTPLFSCHVVQRILKQRRERWLFDITIIWVDESRINPSKDVIVKFGQFWKTDNSDAFGRACCLT